MWTDFVWPETANHQHLLKLAQLLLPLIRKLSLMGLLQIDKAESVLIQTKYAWEVLLVSHCITFQILILSYVINIYFKR